MAISFNLSISEENLEKISREKSTYLSSISFIVNGNSFVFNNVPYVAESRQVIKNYEYNGTQLNIVITVDSTLIDLTEETKGYNAVGVVDYKINGNEYPYDPENDVVHLGWSIENSKTIRDNDGYALASTAGAEPDVLYYELTEDTSPITGKKYYELVVVGETTRMDIVDPPSNPKEASLYEAVNQTYYTLTSQTSETGNFIRLDKYGLYGVARPDADINYVPRGIEQIQKDAMFSLTWDGYTLKTSHPDGDGKIEIGADKDITVYQKTVDEERDYDTVGILGYLNDSLPFYEWKLPGSSGEVEEVSEETGEKTYETTLYSKNYAIMNFNSQDNPKDNLWYELNDGQYILTEDESIDVGSPVVPIGSENPHEEHWFELLYSEDNIYYYTLSEDGAVVSGKVYYAPKLYYTLAWDFSKAFLGINVTEVYIAKFEGEDVLQYQDTSEEEKDYYFDTTLSDNPAIVFHKRILNNDNIRIKTYSKGSYGAKNKYGVYSNNLYIGDVDNYLSFYKDSDQSTFIIKTDNFYFDTEVQNQKNIRELLSSTADSVENMSYLYHNLDSWISVGEITEGTSTEGVMTFANHNKPQSTELQITSKAINFIEDNHTVASITGNEMTISNTNISDKMQFNDYAFITRSNGNMSLKYIG